MSTEDALKVAAIAWAGFWVTFGIVDWAADKRGLSLCSATRWAFRTNTAAGRLAFTAAYGTGAMVLYAHVAKSVIEDLADEMAGDTQAESF